MSKGTGYGKVILFGEHFVVYGCPAIAVGISNKAVIDVVRADKVHFTTSTPGCVPELTTNAVLNVLKAMNIADKFHVHLSGDLPTIGGLGSSAAFCVALTRALSEEYRLDLTNEQVNNYAYQGELAFHGTPSGVDNTMATYGGAIKFIKGKGHELVKIGKTFQLVIASSGISSPTSAMVAKVRGFKENNEKKFGVFYKSMEEIVANGVVALESGDISAIGRLMNENQKLLGEIGVSIEQNEKIVEIATKAGALGAKITGGGGGGSCIALAKDEKHAADILDKIKTAGFGGFVTRIKKTN